MSELAKRVIAENKRSKDRFLDLGNCGLAKIPAEVGELLWLEGLSLGSQLYNWDLGWTEDWSEKNNIGPENTLTDLEPLPCKILIPEILRNRSVIFFDLDLPSALSGRAAARNFIF